MSSPHHSYAVSKMRLYEMFAQKSTPTSLPQQHQQQQQQPQQTPPIPLTMESNLLPSSLMPNTFDIINAKLEQMLLEIDKVVDQSTLISIATIPPNHDIYLLIRQIPLLISQSTAPIQTLANLVETVMFKLYKSTTSFGLELYTYFLHSLLEQSAAVAKEALAWAVYADDERKYNAPVVAMMIRFELIPLEEYDVQLAKQLNTSKRALVMDFAADLLRICLLSHTPMTFLEDHILTMINLRKLAENNEASPKVIALLEVLQQSVEQPYHDIKKDIDCLRLRLLLAEWTRLSQHPLAGESMYKTVAKKILEICNDDDNLCFFFRLCTETCVSRFLASKSLGASYQRRAIQLMDAYGKLVAYLVRVGDQDDQGKMKLVIHSFSVVILVLAQHHESRGPAFVQKPFMRLLTALYSELNKIRQPSLNAGILVAFSDALYTLQPLNFTGFAFSWLQLLSHRAFIPQLLVTGDPQGWTICRKLILALLKFLGPLLDKQALQKATKAFYQGTLRFLVVLLHDFPEFLCENYMAFAQVIPHSCIQLRNMVLSAFPRTMHLPDPFTLDLQMNQLLESKQDPALITSSYMDTLAQAHFVSKVDDYIRNATKAHDPFLADCVTLIQRPSTEEEPYRPDMLGALVLYLGARCALLDVPLKENPAYRVYKNLLECLDVEGSYLLLSAMADHLRYPNSHTCFFSTVMVSLFEEMPESIKEKMTRVLLERLIVNRPHPWGLLATFITFIKDSKFWNYEFVHCSPDIERLFDNVSRSIKRIV
ncbi:CCR4-Not complex component, Not1-domain-containing protein [Radiomyces spectabilis]|uniref:CCR4-Not complex component, Not1-domain-containing protein n=1 Tax=Radiomyces spectabilis TaxID=64574 RepID=UPI00221E53DB|nr:CCR4-Not complex component, Not1-domain-containing protein [Radiomyces spectabilis]KAI8368213.1 CCR4-Not complex component, Not1-domain-containing protein [Radiomyces spectabilis]